MLQAIQFGLYNGRRDNGRRARRGALGVLALLALSVAALDGAILSAAESLMLAITGLV